MKASSQPEATAGAISGSVTVGKVIQGVAPRSIAASSRAGSKSASRARTIDGDEGDGEGDVGDGDGEEAARPAQRADEQQQHRDAHHDLGHHHGRDDQAAEQGAAEKTARGPGRARRRPSTVASSWRSGQAEAQPARRASPRWRSRAVPCGREARPHRDQPRVVERVGHHQRDRQVEEGVAEGQHATKAGGPGLAAPLPRLLALEEQMGRPAARAADRHRGGGGQSELGKNSSHSTLPIISVSVPPRRSGITNSPTAGMNTAGSRPRCRAATAAG